MKSTIANMIGEFKRKHRFAATLLSALLVCYVLCIISYLFMTNVILKKSQENEMQLHQSYINIEADNTNRHIYQLHQSLTQLSYSHSILNMVFYTEYKDSNKNLATTDLALTVQNNLLIDSAYMYVAAQELVLTSGHNVYGTNDYEEREELAFISDYLKGDIHAAAYEDSEKISSLFLMDGKLIMARDFPLNGEKRLGTLFYVLNMNEIFLRLNRELNENSRIWVYDARNTPIFSRLTQYPEDISDQIIDALENGSEQIIRLGSSSLLYGSSDLLGWKFLYEVGERKLLPAGTAVQIIGIPLLIIFLITAIFVYLFITSGIYLPKQMGQLIRMVDPAEGADAAPEADGMGNEFEQLNRAISQMAHHKTTLETTIGQVSQDIVTRLFLDLLSGKPLRPDEVENSLRLGQSAFQMKGFYMTCLLYCDGNLETMEPKRHFILTDLERMMAEYNREHHSVSHAMNVDSRTFLVVLSFGLEDSLLKVIKEVSELERIVRALSKNHGIGMNFHIGRIYYSIMDIGFSYKSALEALGNHQSRVEETDSGTRLSPVRETEMEGSGWQADRAGQLLDQIVHGNVDNAYLLVDRIISEILEMSGDSAAYPERYEAFVSALSGKISELEYMDWEAIPNELLAADQVYLSSLSRAEFEAKTRGDCRKLTEELHKMIKKRQNPNIVAAQKYIQEHYSDPNLSLNYVAEAIDVNSSYLSKLFKGTLGVHFTEYLNEYRVQKSMVLLRDTKQTLSQVAQHSGFNSVQNYIRVFKKCTHVTPGQYRKGEV